MKSVVVILGAGASYDVVDVDRPFPAEITPNLRPPLTNELVTDQAVCAAVLPKYGGVRQLATTINQMVRSMSLEAALRELSESSKVHRKAQVQQVPFYLKDVFLRSNTYVTEPVNYTYLAGSLLDAYDRVAFLTLNYELFLDTALSSQGYWGGPYVNQKSYIRKDWLLVKLHGSVNWARRYLPAVATDMKLPVAEIFGKWPLNGQFEDDITVLGDPSLERDDVGFFYPALSVPIEGKYEYVCPPEHTAELGEFLSTCTTVLAIGTSAHDEDLLDLLTLGLGRVENFYVVSSGGDPHPADLFMISVPQLADVDTRANDTGFSDFVVRGGIQGMSELPLFQRRS